MKNFILENNDGTPFDLYQYQGNENLLMIFFRGAWCNHCKKQLRGINNLSAYFEKLGMRIVAVSSDTKFKSSLLKNFLKLKFPVISDSNFEIIDSFDLRTRYKEAEVAKPAVFIFSPNHEILFHYIGENYDDRLSGRAILLEAERLQRNG
ncbi:peroxiredoxin family protein [Patescibacteria group bacterium]|nr:peroxiredoxin family protein [Patescibacteria group bacterium]